MAWVEEGDHVILNEDIDFIIESGSRMRSDTIRIWLPKGSKGVAFEGSRIYKDTIGIRFETKPFPMGFWVHHEHFDKVDSKGMSRQEFASGKEKEKVVEQE